MRKNQIQKIKISFLEQKEEINKKLAKNDENEYDVDGDEIDIAAGAILVKMQEDLSMRLLKQLRNIESALKRIDDGTFGECEECGEDIAEKRLLAKPDAITCILCAEKLEHKAKQFKKD
jgi:DnaK suppressor protein